jgi:hypothetical protein
MELYRMPNTPNISGPQSGGLENEPEKKKEEDRKVGGFWWWSPAYLAGIVLGITGWYFWYLSHHKHEAAPVQSAQLLQPAQAQPVHVVREKIESAYFYRVDGKDTAGRAASFDFIVLTGDYTWALGSHTDVVSKGAAVPEAETAERVLSPKIRDSLSSATDLISVGLASQEGEREAEEARAVARSQTIAGWLGKVSSPSMALWSLTLGQYSGTCKHQEAEDTSFERPIILSGVRSKADGANLQEALADAISGHDNLPSRECYSRFDMTKVR